MTQHWFQRDYSWGEQEWEDLWADILGTLPENGEPAHYMGYLVLQTADNRFFEVIDGQQRLTTLNLIVLAAMRLIKELIQQKKDAEKNQKRLEQLRASYVGYLDPAPLRSQSKLTLNRNNNDYYTDYLVTLADHLPQRGFTASTHTLRKGFEWFKRHLNQSVKTEPDVGMALARLIETMSDKLFFTVITVADELNAYKVFETLNARGVRLSSTDLLKNYLFSVAARTQHSTQELPDLERRWENLVGRLVRPKALHLCPQSVLPHKATGSREYGMDSPAVTAAPTADGKTSNRNLANCPTVLKVCCALPCQRSLRQRADDCRQSPGHQCGTRNREHPRP